MWLRTQIASSAVYLYNGAVDVECSTVQVFHCWFVSFDKLSVKKPGHNRALADAPGTQNHQTISLLVVRHLGHTSFRLLRASVTGFARRRKKTGQCRDKIETDAA